MIVLGVDPGLSGAIAVYNADRKAIIDLVDIPTFTTLTGGKKRRKLDVSELIHTVGRLRAAWSPDFVVIEEVTSMPNDGGVQAFAFGWVASAIYTAFVGHRYRIEMVRPNVWKQALRAPKLDAAIGARADELFPGCGQLWRGPRGAVLHNRAEAAMIAKYGAEKFGGVR